jgi:hypothetical protein
MGSPVTAMLGNAGVTGTSMDELCARAGADQRQREALGCPPETAAAPPLPAVQEAGTPPAPGLPQIPDYPGIAEALQRTPQLAGAMSAPAVAGGQAYQATAPAAAAYQQPGIVEMLKAYFGG